MSEHWVGTLGVVVALVLCCFALVVGLLETTLRGRPQVRAWLSTAQPLLVAGVVVGVLTAVIAMEVALVTHDFSLAYVVENNATTTPLIYSITGLWSALEGSILLWAFILCVVTALFVLGLRGRRDDPVYGWASVTLLTTSAFFLGLLAGPASPFTLSGGQTPTQGAGPNALLQDNPLVAIHPPLIYTGLVLMAVPFAIAVGTLVAGRSAHHWRRTSRRVALLAWAALGVGLVLGAWWSYQVLGWGGFWGWDPVENAALVPWLVATALVHTLVVEERRGLFRVWNLVLATAAFCLTILATYLTRSGVLVSVHAFSSSTLGPLLLGFLAASLVCGLGLVAWRGDQLRSDARLDGLVSREGSFVANNLVIVGLAALVLLGTVFPLLYEAVRHTAVTVGPPYFDTVAVPAGLCVLALMAVSPLLGWRRAPLAAVWRRFAPSAWAAAAVLVVLVALGVRGVLALVAYLLATGVAVTSLRAIATNLRAATARGASWVAGLFGPSSGGMVSHLGVALAAVAIVSSTSFATHDEVVLRPRQTTEVAGHAVQFVGLRTVRTPGVTASEVVVRVDRGGEFFPALSDYLGRDEVVDTPAIDSSLFGDDVYLTVDGVDDGAVSAAQPVPGLRPGDVVLGVTVEPLVAWLWVGGILAGLGAMLALGAPRRRRSRVEVAAEDATVRAPLEAVPT